MLNNFPKALSYVLDSEGGFVDNPNDSGGATMKGITLETYRIFKRNSHLTASDLKNISDQDVHDIYFKNYWNMCRCSELPSGIDYCVFDLAVNAGVGRSIKTLQKSVVAHIDGVLGSNTLNAINKINPKDLIINFANEREQFYRSIVEFKPSQSEFLKGWLNRTNKSKTLGLGFLQPPIVQ